MTARNPLVLVAGEIKELPSGDTVNGAGGSVQNDLVLPFLTGGVRDTTASTGTGSIALDSTVATGYRTFGAALADGTVTGYCIQGAAGEWEVGRGSCIAPAVGDPSYSNVSLLLHGGGANNGVIFTDSSVAPVTVTPFGNTTTSSTQSKFGGTSMYFDGTGDYLLLPANSPAVAFGSGDFTIECWVYPALSNAFQRILYGQGDLGSAAGTAWEMGISNGTPSCSFYSGTNTYSTPAVNPAVNAWSHVAMVRAGSLLYAFLNGALIGTAACSGTVNAGATTYPPSIGGNSINNMPYAGYIDDVRITKGEARYTSAFTPQTTAFGNFTGPVIPATTLTRTLVRRSSNNNAPVSFSAGTKQVFALAFSEVVESSDIGHQYAFSRGFALP